MNDHAGQSFRGKEILQAQERFTKILMAAAGQGQIEIRRFKYLGVKFTRAERAWISKQNPAWGREIRADGRKNGSCHLQAASIAGQNYNKPCKVKGR